jgi:hypothetical protein
MRIMRVNRRHDVAFNQTRDTADQRDQPLVVVLVEDGLGAVRRSGARVPLAKPGYSHEQFPCWTRHPEVAAPARPSKGDGPLLAVHPSRLGALRLAPQDDGSDTAANQSHAITASA